MKKVLMLGIVVLTLTACQKKQQPNFSGQWLLDKGRSINLPPEYLQLDTLMLGIRHISDTVYVSNVMIQKTQRAALPWSLYTVSDAEYVKFDSVTGNRRWSKSQWSEDNKRLTVMSRIKKPRGVPSEYTQTDIWELTNDKELSVAMTVQISDSMISPLQRRVFKKID